MTAPSSTTLCAGGIAEGPGWSAAISSEPLDPAALTARVTDPGAGAIASFVGTTRDSFGGKAVLRLEYEAYVPMALAKLQALCEAVHARWGVTRVAVAHRTGLVGVTEPSVVIAVSSPHRAAALQAVAWAIDELKASVPIWKKELYADGSAWKENAESRAGAAGAGAAATAAAAGAGAAATAAAAAACAGEAAAAAAGAGIAAAGGQRQLQQPEAPS